MKIVKPNQCPFLKWAISSQKMVHLRYFQHLLVSLGTTEFTSHVKDIVCATFHKDYLKIIKIYEEKVEELNSVLMKIGHKFEQENIFINDYDRWIGVFLIIEPQYMMASCTNQIESENGHMMFNIHQKLFVNLKILNHHNIKQHFIKPRTSEENEKIEIRWKNIKCLKIYFDILLIKFNNDVYVHSSSKKEYKA